MIDGGAPLAGQITVLLLLGGGGAHSLLLVDGCSSRHRIAPRLRAARAELRLFVLASALRLRLTSHMVLSWNHATSLGSRDPSEVRDVFQRPDGRARGQK